MRIANGKCREAVTNKQAFKGDNLFGVQEEGWYVVYSYEKPFPPFLYCFPIYAYSKGDEKWYGNRDKYSSSTRKHQSQAKPLGVEIEYVSTEKLIEMIERGFDK